MIGQHRDIGAARAQRRQRDRHHVDPVVEVLAEALLGDLFGQIAIGGGDQPHVDVEGLVAADPPHFLFLQHAQQLGLQPETEIGDLVEEQR